MPGYISWGSVGILGSAMCGAWMMGRKVGTKTVDVTQCDVDVRASDANGERTAQTGSEEYDKGNDRQLLSRVVETIVLQPSDFYEQVHLDIQQSRVFLFYQRSLERIRLKYSMGPRIYNSAEPRQSDQHPSCNIHGLSTGRRTSRSVSKPPDIKWLTSDIRPHSTPEFPEAAHSRTHSMIT